MINTTLCYITRGNDVLMLHRVKKEKDINKDKWIGHKIISSLMTGRIIYGDGKISHCKT